MIHTRINHSKGFTLLEVIVSLALLTTFTLVFAGLIGNSVSANKLNEERLSATLLAQSELEALRFARDSSLKSDDDFFQLKNEIIHSSDGLFQLSIEMKNIQPSLIEITVSVTSTRTNSPLAHDPITLKTMLFVEEEES
ncbi:type II secretory pathway, pseudopilin PulG [Bacillus sp. TS-2]|nr:type II secretory pathway, pseudopilin PulG [Bacillus sp. TS-2]